MAKFALVERYAGIFMLIQRFTVTRHSSLATLTPLLVTNTPSNDFSTGL